MGFVLYISPPPAASEGNSTLQTKYIKLEAGTAAVSTSITPPPKWEGQSPTEVPRSPPYPKFRDYMSLVLHSTPDVFGTTDLLILD